MASPAQLFKAAGLKEGLNQGRVEGQREAKYDIARRLWQQGMELEVISKVTELPVSNLEELLAA